MLTVKNWPKFQHFKDRDPIWIKYYRSTVEDEELMRLPPRSFRTLLLLWLMAAKKGGRIPDSIESIRYFTRDETLPQSVIDELVQKDFLVRDSAMISERYQDDTPEKRREEPEVETEERESGGGDSASSAEVSSKEDVSFSGLILSADSPRIDAHPEALPSAGDAHDRPPARRRTRNRGIPEGQDAPLEFRGEDSPPDDPVLVEFPCSGRIKTTVVHFGWLRQFAGLYPGLDLAREVLKARKWVDANPKKKKTAAGMTKFLTGWFGRAQNGR